MDASLTLLLAITIGAAIMGIGLWAAARRSADLPHTPAPDALAHTHAQPQTQAHTSASPASATNATALPASGTALPADVGAFYDASTADFLKVYGEVIQAFRTRDPRQLLDYQIKAIGFKAGEVAVDAGCGVGGPACYFAAQTGVEIHALTISAVQAQLAQEQVAAKGLSAQVHVHHADYHQMGQLLPAASADVVYFLESFGHSHDKEAAIAAAWQVLKPGGRLYIKDLFLKEPLHPGHVPLMQREVDRINGAYRYHIADLYDVLRILRQSGWILSQLKTIDLPLEDFENLSISNEFQELTGIGRIDSWKDYVFPVEFYELCCIKPWHDPLVGDNRFFLQNMYYMQVHGKSEAELAVMRIPDEPD